MDTTAVAGRSAEGWGVARLPPEWFGGGGAGYAWDGIDLEEEAAGEDGLAHVRVGGGVVVTAPLGAGGRKYLCSAWPNTAQRGDPDAPSVVDCCVTADPLPEAAEALPASLPPGGVEVEVVPLDDPPPAPATSVTLANHPSTPHDQVLALGRHASCALLSAVLSGGVVSLEGGVHAPALGGWFSVVGANPPTGRSPLRLVTPRTMFHINLKSHSAAPVKAAAGAVCPMPGLEEAWGLLGRVSRVGGSEGVLLHGSEGLGKASVVKRWAATQGRKVVAIDCRQATVASLRDAAAQMAALRDAAAARGAATAAHGGVVLLLENVDGVDGGRDVLRHEDVRRLAAAVALIETVSGADTQASTSNDDERPPSPKQAPSTKAKPFSFTAPTAAAKTAKEGPKAKPKRHVGRWGAVVVGIATSLSGVPMMLRRSGRFGFECYTTPPDEGTRARIFQALGLADAAASAAAELTAGCTGGDLAAVYKACEATADGGAPTLAAVRAACASQRASLQRGVCTQLTGYTSFDAIGGLGDVKESLDRLLLWPLRNPETCKRFGVRPPKGLLLYGPPGTGKTLLVRALASSCKRSLLSLDAAALFACYVGESEAILRAAFAKARLLAPSFLFIDEVESVCGRERQGGGGGGIDVATGVLTTLLNELDGVDTGGADVIFLAATNHPEALDTAILRPGRIDKLLHIPAPEAQQRLDILKLYSQHLPLSSAGQACLPLFADVPTEGFTGADIKSFVAEASYAALRRVLRQPPLLADGRHEGEGEVPCDAPQMEAEVDKKDFIEAMRRVMPSVTPAVAAKFAGFASTVTVS
eukprot:TRINITY_DN253_c0_g3_i1.p1 TRINITY_DN253_c0_g3~~TRINITY_DN253_c0_g3_i1.p1  ORF type:complete len:814 (+),score=175.38 TRINITY_DN253_c0_g3_i1:103-2544(+)